MEFNSVQDFKSNFAHVYHKSVVPMLAPFEKEKNSVKIINYVIWGIVALTAIILYLCNRETPEILIGVILLCCVVAFSITKFLCKNFENKLKTKIMPVVMKAFGDFIWTKSYVIDKYTIKESTIFDRFEDKKDDDSFYGTYKGLAININETELTYTTRDSEGRTEKHTEFKGVIAQIDFKKRFMGHTIIRNRCFANRRVYEEIKLEDPEFSKKYYVDGSDQVESRYILTTSFMERFKNIKTAFRASSIQASIKDSKILIAISTDKDLFRLGDINKPINDTKQFTELLNEFVSILAIVDELKLNQNIGL